MSRRERSASAGLDEVTGTYGDIVVGSKIKGRKGTLNDVWEVIETRNPAQYDPHMTGWFRTKNVATGEEATVEPRVKTRTVTFMVPEGSHDLTCPNCKGSGEPQSLTAAMSLGECVTCDGTGVNPKPKLDPKTQPERTHPADAEAVDLLVRELGAVQLAVKDHDSGEWRCPPYEEMVGSNKELIHHLEVAHDVDMSNVEVTDTVQITTLHGDAHRPLRPHVGKGGFPHRHVYVTQATEAT